MAHHLVFVNTGELEPAIKNDKAAILKSVGLEDHVVGSEAMQINGDDSPSGEAGLLFAWRTKGDDQIVVAKDRQQWRKSGEGGKYWVGVWNDKLPTEEQLRRNPTQRGPWIEFGGQKWKFPLPATIDKLLIYQDDGSYKTAPLREFSWYSDEMEKRADALEWCDKDGNPVAKDHEGDRYIFGFLFDPADVASLVLRVMRINYRITPEVASMMELLTEHNIDSTYRMMIGLVPNRE